MCKCFVHVTLFSYFFPFPIVVAGAAVVAPSRKIVSENIFSSREWPLKPCTFFVGAVVVVVSWFFTWIRICFHECVRCTREITCTALVCVSWLFGEWKSKTMNRMKKNNDTKEMVAEGDWTFQINQWSDHFPVHNTKESLNVNLNAIVCVRV